MIFEHAAVQSVAVAGLPGEVRGETVRALVVLRPGGSATADEVVERRRRNLARFKVPRRITFIDEVPLTASGKIRRFKLRELAGAGAGRGKGRPVELLSSPAPNLRRR